MLTIIDADSIFYIIGNNYKEVEPDPMSINQMRSSLDSLIDMVLTLTRADTYVGFMGHTDRDTFRNTNYKYAEYKGNRPPEEPWLTAWKPHIREWMYNWWGFTSIRLLEADDLAALLAEDMSNHGEYDFTIASPDKDMKQIAGRHFDYKKSDNPIITISDDEAFYHLCVQVISGDDRDNVKGVPKLGPVKAGKLIDAANDRVEYWSIVKRAYINYFGEHYGPIIYLENRNAIQLMGIHHHLYDQFANNGYYLRNFIKPVPKNAHDRTSSIFE